MKYKPCQNLNFFGLAASLFSILFLQVHGSIVDFEQIPDTDLFTGQFYTIDNQGGNQGRLTYSYTKLQKDTGENDRYQHLQIAFGSEMKNYVPGGIYWKDAQWIFIKSEKEGCYIMVMKSNPTDVIGWAGKSPRGKYAVKDTPKDNYKLPDYSVGGKYRDDILWKFVAEKDKPGTYGIYNCRFTSENGILTWTNGDSDDKPPQDRSWVEILTSGTPEHSGGYLWKITPVIEYLDALITNGESSGDLEARARRQFLMRDAEIINPRKDVQTKTFIGLKTNLLYSYNFTIDDDMSIFKEVRFYIQPTEGSPDVRSGPTKPEKGKVYSGAKEKELKIDRNLALGPNSCVKWDAGYMRVQEKEINIPMTFEFSASSFGDGIRDPERTISTDVEYSAETTTEYIKTSGFTGQFVKQGFTSPIYTVKGKMAADTALKTFMTARNVQCSPDNY